MASGQNMILLWSHWFRSIIEFIIFVYNMELQSCNTLLYILAKYVDLTHCCTDPFNYSATKTHKQFTYSLCVFNPSWKTLNTLNLVHFEKTPTSFTLNRRKPWVALNNLIYYFMNNFHSFSIVIFEIQKQHTLKLSRYLWLQLR